MKEHLQLEFNAGFFPYKINLEPVAGVYIEEVKIYQMLGSSLTLPKIFIMKVKVNFTILKYVFARFTSCIAFFNILNELNDYAGQREVVAEEMAHRVYGELMRYAHDLKTERKMVIFIIFIPL